MTFSKLENFFITSIFYIGLPYSVYRLYERQATQKKRDLDSCKDGVLDVIYSGNTHKILNYKSCCKGFDDFQTTIHYLNLKPYYDIINHPGSRVEFIKKI